ncbi:hypothetical protein LZ32DRAFT_687908 [Colletotrichum eremochloae]|nr:hypothetical protein LZ32DRAFT_687908 [Colletotrichum eremochloae]
MTSQRDTVAVGSPMGLGKRHRLNSRRRRRGPPAGAEALGCRQMAPSINTKPGLGEAMPPRFAIAHITVSCNTDRLLYSVTQSPSRQP